MGFKEIDVLTVSSDRKVAGLTDRPNRSKELGGNGMSADALKQRFDYYSDKILEKLNEIIVGLGSDTEATESGEAALGNGNYIKLSLGELSSLADLVGAVASGELASYLTVISGEESSKSLLSWINHFLENISAQSELNTALIQTDGELENRISENEANIESADADIRKIEEALAEKASSASVNELTETLDKRSAGYSIASSVDASDGAITLALKNSALEDFSSETRAELPSWLRQSAIKGFTVSAEVDSENKLVITLSNKELNYQSSVTVDILLQSMIVSVDDFVDESGKKWISLKLKDGSAVNVELNEIFQGYATQDELSLVDARVSMEAYNLECDITGLRSELLQYGDETYVPIAALPGTIEEYIKNDEIHVSKNELHASNGVVLKSGRVESFSYEKTDFNDEYSEIYSFRITSPLPIKPGTLSFDSSSFGIYTDNGDGTLTSEGGYTASVDYASGDVALDGTYVPYDCLYGSYEIDGLSLSLTTPLQSVVSRLEAVEASLGIMEAELTLVNEGGIE